MKNEENIYRRLTFHNFVEINKNIWFWAANYNALFYCHPEGGIATKVFGIKPGEQAKGSLYGKIIHYKNKIIAIPLFADQIMVYDLDKAQARFVELNIEDWGTLHALDRGKFWDAVVQGEYVYLIGFWSTLILKFHMEKERIEEIVDLFEDMDIPIDKRDICFKFALPVSDKIIIPCYVRNLLFVLNPKNMQYERQDIQKEGFGFSGLMDDGENIWLLPYTKGPFIKIDKQNRTLDYFDKYPETYYSEYSANIFCTEYCNGKIWIMPYKANKVISIEYGGEEISIQTEDLINDYYENLETHEEIVKYLFVQKKNHILYSFCSENRKLLAYDTNEKILHDYEYIISDRDYFEFCSEGVEIIYEEDNYFKFYIDILSHADYDICEKRHIYNEFGNKIYNSIIR